MLIQVHGIAKHLNIQVPWVERTAGGPGGDTPSLQGCIHGVS